MVRDGRAVANSMLQVGWWLGFGGPERWQRGRLPPDLAVQWEKADDRSRCSPRSSGESSSTRLTARADVPDDQWLEIRYEDITAQPRESFYAMLRFCGLEWNDEFERGFARHHVSSSPLDASRRDLDPTQLARMTEVIAPTPEACDDLADSDRRRVNF